MTWFSSLRPRKPVLTAAAAAAVQGYEAAPAPCPQTDIREMRFVVVDVETAGLDPGRDALLAIGAVAVDRSLVHFESSFTALLRQEHASSAENILLHGIGGTAQGGAPVAVDSLTAFLKFAGKAPLVGFHVDFDRVAIDRALRAHLGMRLSNDWLDLARLAPAFMTEHSAPRALDDWTRTLGITNYRRHDALADALATAQLLQIVLARAAAERACRLADLADADRAQRWLERR